MLKSGHLFLLLLGFGAFFECGAIFVHFVRSFEVYLKFEVSFEICLSIVFVFVYCLCFRHFVWKIGHFFNRLSG